MNLRCWVVFWKSIPDAGWWWNKRSLLAYYVGTKNSKSWNVTEHLSQGPNWRGRSNWHRPKSPMTETLTFKPKSGTVFQLGYLQLTTLGSSSWSWNQLNNPDALLNTSLKALPKNRISERSPKLWKSQVLTGMFLMLFRQSWRLVVISEFLVDAKNVTASWRLVSIRMSQDGLMNHTLK